MEKSYQRIKQEIDLYYQYIDRITALFKYLNGRVNTLNKCILNYGGYANGCFAHFQYPNYVTVYLMSIIEWALNEEPNLSNTLDNIIMSLAALTISHELYHADQDILTFTYSKDAQYAENVEFAAEYNAEIFCESHKAYFKRKFGFTFCISPHSKFGIYNKNTIRTHYINTIAGIFRNQYVTDEFIRMIDDDKIENAIIMIDLNGKISSFIFKYYGKITETKDDITQFNKIFMRYRHGTASTIYSMRVMEYTSPQSLTGEIYHILRIVIEGEEYEPFLYN